MNEISSVVSELSNKVDSLIAKCEQLKMANVQLQEELQLSQMELSEKSNENEESLEKIKVLKLAKSLTSVDDNTTDARKKINDLVKEIDKCIGLLNK